MVTEDSCPKDNISKSQVKNISNIKNKDFSQKMKKKTTDVLQVQLVKLDKDGQISIPLIKKKQNKLSQWKAHRRLPLNLHQKK